MTFACSPQLAYHAEPVPVSDARLGVHPDDAGGLPGQQHAQVQPEPAAAVLPGPPDAPPIRPVYEVRVHNNGTLGRFIRRWNMGRVLQICLFYLFFIKRSLYQNAVRP